VTTVKAYSWEDKISASGELDLAVGIETDAGATLCIAITLMRSETVTADVSSSANITFGRNLDHSSSKHPKKSTKHPKKSSKPSKKGTEAPKSTKTPKNILKSKKESEKPDNGATPFSIENATYPRNATMGFHGAVMASVIW